MSAEVRPRSGEAPPLTIAAVTATKTKTHDAATASAAAPTALGLQTGDRVSGAAQSYDSKNAGPRTLSASRYTINHGNAGGNYTISTQAASGTITSAGFTLSAVSDTKVYDGTTVSSRLRSPQDCRGATA
jgi:hypothetical protein